LESFKGKGKVGEEGGICFSLFFFLFFCEAFAWRKRGIANEAFLFFFLFFFFCQHFFYEGVLMRNTIRKVIKMAIIIIFSQIFGWAMSSP
jgi:hypothetical protein